MRHLEGDSSRKRLTKNMMLVPVVLLLALSGVPALAKNDNGNGKGQFNGNGKEGTG